MNDLGKTIPKKVLVLILKELRKAVAGWNRGYNFLDPITNHYGGREIINGAITKFGIINPGLSGYEFFWMLFLFNTGNDEITVDNIEVPHLREYIVTTEEDIERIEADLYEHHVFSYSDDTETIESLLKHDADFVHYNGTPLDSVEKDARTLGWKVSDIKPAQISESGTKGVNDKLLENSIHPKTLKLILKKLISAFDGDPYAGDPYENDISWTRIENVTKIFGLSDLDTEDYGFFWQLYQHNKDYEDGDDIKIPRLKKYDIDYRVSRTEWFSEYWRVQVLSYAETNNDDLIRHQANHEDYNWYDGEYIDRSDGDGETDDVNLDEIIDYGFVNSPENISEFDISKRNKLRQLIHEAKRIQDEIKKTLAT